MASAQVSEPAKFDECEVVRGIDITPEMVDAGIAALNNTTDRDTVKAVFRAMLTANWVGRWVSEEDADERAFEAAIDASQSTQYQY